MEEATWLRLTSNSNELVNGIKDLLTFLENKLGIKTDDITNFAELFDVPPPEDDKAAYEMAKKIRKWVADGRPK